MAPAGRAGSKPVDVQFVRTREELESLRPEWAALWSRCPQASTFQRPEWLWPWQRRFGSDALLVVVVRAEGELVGLLTLRVRTDRSGDRILTLLGEGLAELQDALVAPDHAPAVHAALESALVASREEWDLCELDCLPAGATMLKLSPGHAWTARTQVLDSHPVLELRARGNGAGPLPDHVAARIGRDRKRAEAAGRLEVELADSTTWRELLTAVFELQEAGDNDRAGDRNTSADEATRAFHEDVAGELDQSGALRLFALRMGDRIIAAQYGFMGNGRSAAYMTACDPAFGRLGPASLLLGHAIEQAHRDGCSAFDFLHGRDPLEYGWGAEDRLRYRRRIRPRRIAGHAPRTPPSRRSA
jgi:CelD/BcsL family acetyltransferase involved in cellulose biosynthesis